MKRQLYSLLIIGLYSFNAFSQINLNLGLVAYYPFNDNANDMTVNAFNGSLSNSPALVNDKIGRATAAYKFNGTNSLIKLGDILDTVFAKSPVANFSISGWAKTDTLSNIQGDNVIISKSGGGVSGPYQWYILHENDGRVKGLVSYTSAAASDFYEVESSTQIPANNWFNFTLTYDGSLSSDTSRLKFYVNGVYGVLSRRMGNPGRTTINSDQEVVIGGTYNTSNNPLNVYAGTIDEIRIYNRTLNYAEVMELQNFTTVYRTAIDKNLTINENIEVYPNPNSSGMFTINTKYLIQSVSVHDILGQNVKQMNSVGNQLDLTDLQKGNYIIYVIQDNNYTIKKISIQ
ncbi:MAG: LamG-like jellyroll fold domain-containing protein [Bacteroidia bacterium]|jgi:hypothetical protein